MSITPAEMAGSLRCTQARFHSAIWPRSLALSVLVAAVLLYAVGAAVTSVAVTAWLAAMVTALAVRAVIGVAHRRAGVPDADAARWLGRHRVAFGLHGLAWAVAGVLLPPHLGNDLLVLMVFAFTAITAASLVVTAFDVAAGLTFTAPALGTLLAVLLLRGDPHCTLLAVMVTLFTGVMMLAAQRSQSLVREAVAARLVQSARETEAAEARQQAQEQHQLLQQLMRGTDEGFWFIDNDGVTTELNPAMCRLLGREREAVLGRSVFEFFAGEHLQTMRREIAARQQGQQRAAYEIGMQRPDGSWVYCLNQATAVTDTQGRKIGSVGIWTDISARREAEIALRMYERVANATSDLISVVGEDRVYRMVNDAWCVAARVSREEALGRSTSDFLDRQANPERVAALASCFRDRQAQRVTALVHFRQAPSRLMETTYSPFGLSPDGVRCVVMVSRDVSETERARLALQDSEEYLSQTLGATDEAIFATDAEGPDEPVRFNNQRMLDLFGIELAEGQPLTPRLIMARAAEIFDKPEEEVPRIQEVIAGRQVHVSHVPLKDGRVLLRRYAPAQVRGVTLRVWSFRDITAEVTAVQTLERTEAEQRALLDAFPGFIARLNERLVYTYVNPPFAALLGRKPAELVGLSVAQVFGEQAAAEFLPSAQRTLAGEVVVYEFHHPQPGRGYGTDIQVTLAPGRDPRSQMPAVYGFAVDITARKRAEAAVIAARDEAERANLAKSQFLSHMSHELRTPMNAILGFGQLLESDAAHPLARQQQGWVREILRGARHLLTLINEVLDFGRIESGHLVLKPESIQVSELVEEVLALVRPLALQREVRLLPSTGPLTLAWVAADRTRLQQVLLNLLGNAIKYNRVGGQVQLACRIQHGEVWLGVQDTGPGIAPELQPRLFQPFERLGAAQGPVEGTGIGLALCHRLVLAMGGAIGVDSEPGVGSTFWLRLPQTVARQGGLLPAPVVVPAPAPAGPARQRLVLYVEDNAINAELMQAMLARLEGVRLVIASEPAQGLRLARELQPALVLLDIQMPGMDGFEVIARLRADPLTRDLPVVAVSANAMPSDIQAARAAGFGAYLTKPLNMDLLLETVRRNLDGAPAG